MTFQRRRTKILATLGPATDAPGVLDAILRAGVDVVRLNMSHGTHEAHREVYERVRAKLARGQKLTELLTSKQLGALGLVSG